MGKKRLEKIKATQPDNLGCLNPKNWHTPKHNWKIAKNSNGRLEKMKK
jgi:hypothetical protein